MRMGINGPWITKSYLELILERKGWGWTSFPLLFCCFFASVCVVGGYLIFFQSVFLMIDVKSHLVKELRNRVSPLTSLKTPWK